jgi:hypothetical protein
MLRQCRVIREGPRGSRKCPNCYSKNLTDRLFCSVLLPLFAVVGMDRCEKNWYACDKNLRGTPPEEAECGQVAYRPSLDCRDAP